MKCPIRALAITGMLTAAWMPAIISGSDMRATPPSRRMSAGTRSSAITAAAPACSATVACAGVTTSMITPPLSISARPVLTWNVASSRIAEEFIRGRRAPGRAVLLPAVRPRRATRPITVRLLQPERLDAIVVLRRVLRVDAVGQRLDQAQQGRVRAHVARAVGGVELELGELRDL